METLQQIKTLERLVEFGLDDGIIGQTVNKLISSQIQKQQRGLVEIQAKLTSFEAQYKLSSEVFQKQFHQGQLGDKEDFFEWDALVQMRARLEQQLALLNTTK